MDIKIPYTHVIPKRRRVTQTVAFFRLVIDDCFVINNCRVIRSERKKRNQPREIRYFVSMPQCMGKGVQGGTMYAIHRP